MKRNRGSVALSVIVVAALFTGCSSNGGDSSASPATKTTGVITSIRSGGSGAAALKAGSTTKTNIITVNGIDFTMKAGIDPATAVHLKFEEKTAPESNLKPGMIVTVNGSVVSAPTGTKTGEFESVEFQPELRGPLDSQLITAATNTIKVMGHDVAMDAKTKFDGITGIADLQSKLSGTLHPEIEVSGYRDGAGVFHATLIALKDDDFSEGGKVEVEGVIESAPAPSAEGFMIGDISVAIDGNTAFEHMAAADVVPGALVEVKGVLSGTTLTAIRIEQEDGRADGVAVNDHVDIEGIVAVPLSGDTFILNSPHGPITVKVNDATVFKQNDATATSSMVVENAILEVEGTMQADNSILAREVDLEDDHEGESDGGDDGK